MKPGTPENSSSASSRDALYNQFVGLLARHDHGLRRFVRSLLPSNEGVDDVMQETALECWKKFADFAPQTAAHDDGEGGDEFIRWSCVIARYKALSWQRDKSRDRLVFRENVVERLAEAAMNELSHREEEHIAVQSCLDKMSTANRQLVLSVHAPGESVAAIAARTGEKARRLYSQVNALRRKLLECVRNHMSAEKANG